MPTAAAAVTVRTMKRFLAALAVLIGLGAAYARRLREPILTWGATAEEAAAHLPGDELLEDADGVATRAITVDAPASAVWPWLAQMGPSPRGGAYTYDWIENLLRLDMHSVDRVLPEFQHPKLGEGFGFGENQMRYALVDPEHVLAQRVGLGPLAEEGPGLGARKLEGHGWYPSPASAAGRRPSHPSASTPHGEVRH